MWHALISPVRVGHCNELRGIRLSCVAVHSEASCSVVVRRLKEWLDSLKNGQMVNVGVFEIVAEEHDVDIYVLEAQMNTHTRENVLHAVRYSAWEGELLLPARFFGGVSFPTVTVHLRCNML